MWIRRLIRRLFRTDRRARKHGGRVISPYTLPGADLEEKTLILGGVARSPEDARYLMRKYATERAQDVLARVKPKKQQKTPRERFIEMIRRAEGHDARNPYRVGRDDRARVEARYRYRSGHRE